MYNTGSQSRGFRNGYVARVENAGRRVSGRPATAIPTVIVGDQPASAAVSDTGAGRVPVELAEIAAENMEAAPPPAPPAWDVFGSAQHRSEEHTSELQSLMRISYAVFCLKNKKTNQTTHIIQ